MNLACPNCGARFGVKVPGPPATRARTQCGRCGRGFKVLLLDDAFSSGPVRFSCPGCGRVHRLPAGLPRSSAAGAACLKCGLKFKLVFRGDAPQGGQAEAGEAAQAVKRPPVGEPRPLPPEPNPISASPDGFSPAALTALTLFCLASYAALAGIIPTSPAVRFCLLVLTPALQLLSSAGRPFFGLLGGLGLTVGAGLFFSGGAALLLALWGVIIAAAACFRLLSGRARSGSIRPGAAVLVRSMLLSLLAVVLIDQAGVLPDRSGQGAEADGLIPWQKLNEALFGPIPTGHDRILAGLKDAAGGVRKAEKELRTAAAELGRAGDLSEPALIEAELNRVKALRRTLEKSDKKNRLFLHLLQVYRHELREMGWTGKPLPAGDQAWKEAAAEFLDQYEQALVFARDHFQAVADLDPEIIAEFRRLTNRSLAARQRLAQAEIGPEN